tara:strand:- start:39 stop:212 length:174 start_codon:yes stop_codon:yes gene_type:complete
MEITNAKYVTDEDGSNIVVDCIVDGLYTSVPMVGGNRHYAEILKQVADGTLTIADAD